MCTERDMDCLDTLSRLIDLTTVPYTDHGSRLLLFRRGSRFSIRLAERWVRWETEITPQRQHPPIIEAFGIFDLLGVPAPIEIEAFPHVVNVRTSAGNFAWTFVDPETLMLRLAPGRYGIEFEAKMQRGQTDSLGGILFGERNIAYSTNARLIHNEITSLVDDRIRVNLILHAGENNALVFNVTPKTAFNRALPSSDEVISCALERWQAWFAAVPPVLAQYQPMYHYAWWLIHSGLLVQRYFFTHDRLFPARMRAGSWHWDQFFLPLVYRHVDLKVAEAHLRAVFEGQQENGALADTQGATEPIIQRTPPPLAGWTALRLFEKTGNRAFLKELYEPIRRWQAWWLHDRMHPVGLCWRQYPYSLMEEYDLSPTQKPPLVVAADLNTYLTVQFDSLARIAHLIGKADESAQHFREADAWTRKLVRVLWDEENGVFSTYYDSELHRPLTVFKLFPIWTGRLSAATLARLVGRLANPQNFWSKWPLPSMSLSDPAFNSRKLWSGPTWPRLNYLFVDALKLIGQHELAGRLRRKTLDLILQYQDIYECYHPQTGAAPPKPVSISGWTPAVFIDFAIQETDAARTSSSAQ